MKRETKNQQTKWTYESPGLDLMLHKDLSCNTDSRRRCITPSSRQQQAACAGDWFEVSYVRPTSIASVSLHPSWPFSGGFFFLVTKSGRNFTHVELQVQCRVAGNAFAQHQRFKLRMGRRHSNSLIQWRCVSITFSHGRTAPVTPRRCFITAFGPNNARIAFSCTESESGPRYLA